MTRSAAGDTFTELNKHLTRVTEEQKEAQVGAGGVEVLVTTSKPTASGGLADHDSVSVQQGLVLPQLPSKCANGDKNISPPEIQVLHKHLVRCV